MAPQNESRIAPWVPIRLTASVLSLTEIRQMTNELFAQHKDYLPQFKIHKV